MTLNTPVSNNIGVFDADYPYIFTFSYNGKQAIRNRAVIRDNSTFAVIYDHDQDGLRLNHTLPANTLTNNHTYTVQFQVFDTDGNSSGLSESSVFSCHTTPQFYFSNLNPGDIISAANLTCELHFSQNEGDSLREYHYYLYDSNRSQLSVSDSCYSMESSRYTYYGLENMTSYYIRALGKTVYGFEIDTGCIPIHVKYNTIPTNIAVQAINRDGKILLDVNIISTDYDLDNDNYKLENGELTLTDNRILYHLKDITDFTLVIKARSLPPGIFAEVIADDGTATLSIVCISGKYYCKLTVEADNYSCVFYENIDGQILGSTAGDILTDTASNALQTITGDYHPETLIVFEIHRENNLYALDAYYQ